MRRTDLFPGMTSAAVQTKEMLVSAAAQKKETLAAAAVQKKADLSDAAQRRRSEAVENLQRMRRRQAEERRAAWYARLNDGRHVLLRYFLSHAPRFVHRDYQDTLEEVYSRKH